MNEYLEENYELKTLAKNMQNKLDVLEKECN